MNGYWFKSKLYGWGWTPATWQGWLVLVIFIVLVYFQFKNIDANSHSASDTLINFLPRAGLSILAFIIICLAKGEKSRWRWGSKK